MTAKERIELLVWCQQAVIAARISEASIQVQQLKILASKIKD
jgi:hypothetical protein